MSTTPLNAFAGNPLDRASDRRIDADWLARAAADPDALTVVLWNRKPLVEAGEGEGLRIAYISGALARELAPSPRDGLFLGLWKQTPVFAIDLSGEADPSFGPLAGMGSFDELRNIALRLPAPEAAILATAKGVFEWRSRHGFCAACGGRNTVADGGWKFSCESCRAEHFPRTDPVVIMLAVHGGRCLVGRQAAWPARMFSALAGFLEPGETIEEACARELKEEAGLVATSVRYHSSQPWPYPSSLMIGLIADVDSDQARPDQTELEAVRWLTRAEAAAVLRGEDKDMRAPSPLAIARTLLEAWVEEG